MNDGCALLWRMSQSARPVTRRPVLLSLSSSLSGYPVPMPDNPFSWRGKRVFLTGHTGFKGGWLALWLTSKGAAVRGYALDPYTDPNLLTAARIPSVVEDIRGDIRNSAALEPALHDFAP